jgi:hypothetical protein
MAIFLVLCVGFDLQKQCINMPEQLKSPALQLILVGGLHRMLCKKGLGMRGRFIPLSTKSLSQAYYLYFLSSWSSWSSTIELIVYRFVLNGFNSRQFNVTNLLLAL